MVRTIDIDYAPYIAQAGQDAAVLPRLRDALVERTIALWVSNPYTGHGFDTAGARAVLDDFQTAARVMLRASCTGLDVDFDYVDGYAAQVESVIADCQATLHAHGVIEDVDAPATPAQIAAYVDRVGLAGPDYPPAQRVVRYPRPRPTSLRSWFCPLAGTRMASFPPVPMETPPSSRTS